jgi:Smg protein
MFEVLAYVYDCYWSGPQCPGLASLHRELNAVGFAADDVMNALLWLEDLQCAAHATPEPAPRAAFDVGQGSCADPHRSMRMLSDAEQIKLGSQAWGLLTYLASVGSMSRGHAELVIDRAMAAPGTTLALDDFKLIVLMVFWSLNDVPDPLLTDSLLGDGTAHPVH